MRILLIFPKIHGSYSFFTGINIYHCDLCSGVIFGVLGFGLGVEKFYEKE